MMAIGKPTINSTIMKVTVQSGSPSRGSMMSAASIIKKAVAAYIGMIFRTFRLFSSCQNGEDLLVRADIQVQDLVNCNIAFEEVFVKLGILLTT